MILTATMKTPPHSGPTGTIEALDDLLANPAGAVID
jgi:hypothetical protein